MSDLASKLSDEFKRVYVADLDGIAKNKPQLDVVQEICDEVPTLYEGGVRFAANVIDLLITGAERAVVGTATLSSLEELRKAFMMSENITFKVDYRDGIVSFDPHVVGRAFLDLSRDVSGIGITDIIVPASIAEEAAAAKRELGFSLGVFASACDSARMESLGADFLVAGDVGRRVENE